MMTRFHTVSLFAFSLILFGILSDHQSFGQDLQNHIPSSASVVIEINSENVFNDLPPEYIDGSFIGKSLLEDLSQTLQSEISSLNDLGMDFQKPAYIFMDDNYGQLNLVFLLPVSSIGMLEKFVNQGEYEVYDAGNYKGAPINERTLLNWNANTLSLTFVIPQSESQSTLDEYGNHIIQFGNYLEEKSGNISTIKSFRKGKGSKAAVNFWMGNLDRLMGRVSDMAYRESGMQDWNLEMVRKIYGDYDYFVGSLYVEESKIRLVSEGQLTGKTAEVMGKVSKTKFDSRLFNYLDLESSMAYFTYDINFENFLLEYPGFLAEEYFSFIPEKEGRDEARLGIELLTTIIDEHAIAELIEGEFVFNLIDIGEMEVEYTAYEYDSNFNLIPVKSTRMETVPEFMFLMSSKKTNLTEMTIEYLLKKSIIKNMGGYYQMEAGAELPFNFYFMSQDDILFFGTSQSQFQQIAEGRYTPKVSTEDRKRISDNQAMFYLGPNKVFSLLKEELGENAESELIEELKGIGYIYGQTSKVKKGKIKGSLYLSTPDNTGNSLKFFFDLLNKLAEK